MNTGTKGIAEEVRKPFTAEELSRHDEQLRDWPDAQPSLETLERYLHNIRSLLEELAAKDKVLESIKNAPAYMSRTWMREQASSILFQYAINESKPDTASTSLG